VLRSLTTKVLLSRPKPRTSVSLIHRVAEKALSRKPLFTIPSKDAFPSPIRGRLSRSYDEGNHKMLWVCIKIQVAPYTWTGAMVYAADQCNRLTTNLPTVV
jgi:hypothetical protein